VLIAINSTQSKPDSIILFTAFCQAHPTQTTLILATGEIELFKFTSCGQVVAFGTLVPSKLFSLSSLLLAI
jgi:hypothetical protein